MNKTLPMKVYYYNFIKFPKTNDKSEKQSKKKTHDIPGNKDKNDNRLPIRKNSSQKTEVQLSL